MGNGSSAPLPSPRTMFEVKGAVVVQAAEVRDLKSRQTPPPNKERMRTGAALVQINENRRIKVIEALVDKKREKSRVAAA